MGLWPTSCITSSLTPPFKARVGTKRDNMLKKHETPQTAYEILGLSPNAPQKDIHAALRKLALQWHPDRVPAHRRSDATRHFQAIMDAYAKIRTPEHRKLYDERVKIHARTPVGAPQHRTIPISNDNIPFTLKAKFLLRAVEAVFWPFKR